MLLAAGADPLIPMSEGITPLLLAVAMGYTAVVKVFLNAGADLAQRDCRGSAAVHVGAVAGKEAVLALLLPLLPASGLGSINDLRSEDGAAPLHLATMEVSNWLDVHC
jgi:ankyrin repeat protein